MLELLRTRRSCRQFTEEPVSPAHQALLEEALLRAPTSKNRRPWRFWMVRDPATRSALAQCKPHGAAFVAQAPLAIVVAADTAASDVWIEDASIAAITAQYTAQSLGLGSCWVQVRLRTREDGEPASAYVARVLGLPSHYEVLCIVAVGHPAVTRPGVPREKLAYDTIHRDSEK